MRQVQTNDLKSQIQDFKKGGRSKQSDFRTPVEFPVSDSGRVQRDSETGAIGLLKPERPYRSQ